MAARRILVLFVALGLAGATALYARSWMEGQRSSLPPATATQVPPPPQTIEFREVLVAERNLAAGAFVTPGNVRWQRWPSGSVAPSYVVRGERDDEDMHGAVVRRGLAAGEPVTDGGVVKPGERGFLAAVLTPGMRAISVPVTDTSSHAGLIFPGDHVDMILTQTIAATGNGGEAIVRLASETVLEDIRVIAMGRRLSDEVEVGGDGRVRTTTLEVTPRQAEFVTLVTELGKLSLSLRSLAGDEDGEPVVIEMRDDPVTWDFDVSRLRRNDRATTRRLTLMRGDKSENLNLRTGVEP